MWWAYISRDPITIWTWEFWEFRLLDLVLRDLVKLINVQKYVQLIHVPIGINIFRQSDLKWSKSSDG